MVTSPHEASHRIFQDRPELLAPVFRILGVPLPAKAAVEVLTADVTEIRPLERRVDSVLRIEPVDGVGGFLLAIEAQGRRDPDKAVSWAAPSPSPSPTTPNYWRSAWGTPRPETPGGT